MGEEVNKLSQEVAEERNKDIAFVLEESYKQLEELTEKIVEEYAQELDSFMSVVYSFMEEGDLLDSELERVILTIPMLVYYTGAKAESIALKDAIAREMVRDKYNDTLLKATGTDTVKKSTAEAKSTEERLLNIAYNNAHKKLKHRADTAMEMMNSCKKILTSRIVEKQLSLNKEKIED